MREIKDNAYVFSISPINFGDVIISRTEYGDIYSGKNIFSLLGISSEDESCFCKMLGTLSDSHIALSGKRNGLPRAILFVRAFSYATGMCLAFELDLPVSETASIFDFGAVGEIPVSNSLKALGEDGCKMTCDSYSYLCNLLRELRLFDSIRNLRYMNDAHSVRDAARAVALVVGSRLECEISYKDDGSYRDISDMVFSARFCLATLVIFAMAARSYAIDRTLRFKIICTSEGMYFELGFLSCGEKSDGVWADELMMRALNKGLSFCELDAGGDVAYELIPYCKDEALMGVKDTLGIDENDSYREYYR